MIYSQKHAFFIPLNKGITLINPLRDIILISLLEWDAWDKVFKIKAKSSDL